LRRRLEKERGPKGEEGGRGIDVKSTGLAIGAGGMALGTGKSGGGEKVHSIKFLGVKEPGGGGTAAVVPEPSRHTSPALSSPTNQTKSRAKSAAYISERNKLGTRLRGRK